MNITMKDIAKMANVSVVTVSRAINNSSYVREDTKDLILNIVKRYKYIPHYIARSLVTKKTKSLGLTVFDIVDPFFAKIVRGAEDTAKKYGYNIVLASTDNDPDKEIEAINFLTEKMVDGILLCPVQRDNRYIKILEELAVPYVLLLRHPNGNIKCDYVINDNLLGAYMVVNYLIKKGHRDIHFIVPDAKVTSMEERVRGCKKAIKENGLPVNLLHIHRCKENVIAFYELSKHLFSKRKKPQAVFVWDDILSIGVQKAALEMDLRIPTDVAIVGYDNIDISNYLYASLTTVDYPSYKIGAKGTDILIKKIESNNSTKLKHVVFKPKLIIREST